LIITIDSHRLIRIFHPGGFGDYNYGDRELPMREDPPIIRALFLFLGMLCVWVGCFLLGLSLGFGWFAWPMGTFALVFFLIIKCLPSGKKRRSL